MPTVEFNEDDNKAVSQFLELLVNLGMTPEQAYKSVDGVLLKSGWTFQYFNNVDDFWITDHEDK